MPWSWGRFEACVIVSNLVTWCINLVNRIIVFVIKKEITETLQYSVKILLFILDICYGRFNWLHSLIYLRSFSTVVLQVSFSHTILLISSGKTTSSVKYGLCLLLRQQICSPIPPSLFFYSDLHLCCYIFRFAHQN